MRGMADDQVEGKETSGRGNDWEVVSLTASAYAAAPGPEGFELPDDNRDVVESSKNETESSRALFMSDHFVFPSSEHGNMPLDSDNSYILEGVAGTIESQSGEIRNESAGEGMDTLKEKKDTVDKTGESWTTGKGLLEADSFHGVQFFEEKDRSGSGIYDESVSVCELLTEDQEPRDAPLLSLDASSDVGKSPKMLKEDRINESGLPCEAWWKRQAASLYAQAKEVNSFWSVVVAATLMGLVIVGQRWQQDRWHVQQLKWHFSINDERINQMLGPVSRLKDAIVGGHRRGPVLRSTTSVER